MFELMPFGRNDLYRPFRELENLERSFFSGKELGGFKTDIKDTGDAYVLEADLPGVKREDVNVDVNDGVLTISAEWNTEKKENRQHGYVINERRSGRASRSFTLENVKEDEISAEYKDGVLRLTMPKINETEKSPRRIEIQ